MRLHEYQSKVLFRQCGIPTPQGEVARTPEEARQITEKFDRTVVVKSQVLVGGRGKAGGVRLAESPEEAESTAADILGMTIKGLSVEAVLVEEASDIASEIYLGITMDRTAQKPVLMASMAGGVDIEEIAATSPEKIAKVHIEPLLGLMDYQAREAAAGMGMPKKVWRAFSRIVMGLWKAFDTNDASLAEINPLVITSDGELIAVDGKVILDDNALFRHPEQAAEGGGEVKDPAEEQAHAHGLSYVKLDGDIGCLVNGAGLAMATMDIIKLNGGEPANFLDIGGGASAEKVTAALQIILADEGVKAVLINIFGGITRCDIVAEGILRALKSVKTEVPTVVRLVGTNAEIGRRMLAEAEMITANTLVDATQKAIKAAGGVK
jgi:succinyl-CoA synthetase beta subunit